MLISVTRRPVPAYAELHEDEDGKMEKICGSGRRSHLPVKTMNKRVQISTHVNIPDKQVA